MYEDCSLITSITLLKPVELKICCMWRMKYVTSMVPKKKKKGLWLNLCILTIRSGKYSSNMPVALSKVTLKSCRCTPLKLQTPRAGREVLKQVIVWLQPLTVKHYTSRLRPPWNQSHRCQWSLSQYMNQMPSSPVSGLERSGHSWKERPGSHWLSVPPPPPATFYFDRFGLRRWLPLHYIQSKASHKGSPVSPSEQSKRKNCLYIFLKLFCKLLCNLPVPTWGNALLSMHFHGDCNGDCNTLLRALCLSLSLISSSSFYSMT